MKEGESKAIWKRLFLRLCTVISVTVIDVFDGGRRFIAHSPTVIPTMATTHRDALMYWSYSLELYIWQYRISRFFHTLNTILSKFLLQKYRRLITMADNLHRNLQELDLGVEDEPVALPLDVVNQAAAENRFIIIGRPVIPRRQNIRAIIAALPRQWGHAGLVHGRIVEGRRFQFVFPSEESMENVLRRGPWAFADRMLIMQRWSPLFNPLMLNFIPLWIQIRGIPLQYINQDVIMHIGRAMGQYMDVDYNAETAVRVEYARVRVNWNVDLPLRFQKNFQFTPGVNTLLKFRYERLRGFCEVCGMLTHDSGSCLIQNGGMDHDSEDDDDDEDDNEEPLLVPLAEQGVQIHEIHEMNEENNNEENEVPNGVEYQVMEDDEEYNAEPLRDMFSGEQESSELSNPVPIYSNSTGDSAGDNARQGKRIMEEPDESSMQALYDTIPPRSKSQQARKRKAEASLMEEGLLKCPALERGESSGNDTTTDQVRGAVGPNPPASP